MPDNPYLDLRGNTRHAAEFLSALANDKRLQILSLIVNKEMSVGKISSEIGLVQSAVSQHLARLRELNLVSTRRSAQSVFYMVASPHVELMLSTLSSIYVGSNLHQSAHAEDCSQGMSL
ncbi:DNA-binding transcriptional ArsR family regulator [Ochrobactrum anthropi]|uniref:ArsR/SmtB family transcription factor n=1 Tax=Brucella anthropi TaxID=529 RepID=UPI0015FB185A|nr:metalloregulator ArsR/SmtB family transcription factor [Brucella anthropi]MBA8862750.1 DNA-binding transcriptional ArsR family regulator [Brucella anthropi]